MQSYKLTLQYFGMKNNFQPAEYEQDELQLDEDLYLDAYHPIQLRIGAENFNYSKSGHWSEKQNAKYYAFVLKFKQKFSQKQSRRQWKVFKALSIFVKTRNANQCRSHHHKMTKNHDFIEDALEYLRSKNPSIEERGQKYFEQLQKIDFSAIEDGKFSEFLAKQDYQSQENKKKERDLSINNVRNPYEVEGQCKATDVANMRTEATYGAEVNQYQPPFNMSSGPYQAYPPMGYCYPGYETHPTLNYQLPYETGRDQMWMECHQLFLKWMSKMYALMQY